MVASVVKARPVISQRVVDTFKICKALRDQNVELRKENTHWFTVAESYRAQLAERNEANLSSTPEVSL